MEMAEMELREDEKLERVEEPESKEDVVETI